MHAGELASTALSIARAAISVVVVALALSACTGAPPGPQAPTEITASAPTATPSQSPTPTVDLTVPPVQPRAMDTPSADGAAAAAAYFTKLYAYAYATGDLTTWNGMSEPTCTFCSSVTAGVNAMLSAGESDSSAEIVVTNVSALEITPSAFYSAELQMSQGPSQRYDSAGQVISRGEGQSWDLVFALAWRDGWFVREIDSEPTQTATP
ncbi:DUF6318 family protein [Cellulomonas xylanilytica]|uniref:DUF6318 domain-containing protein n=1 Tax=Cellulomonas xylanilytica TaxID=233583 RepID=A0A510V975_9CELL|nr:DUF6318 family protein [Cellulomonas xylanilytica]GEK23296.1 hypothetical protein CXY01_38160 [Cellulomonas xylanilytica]